jgi:hypothetical protein
MTKKNRVTLLTASQLHALDTACVPVRKAFGHPPYLVGTAGIGDAEHYRDVDVRLILSDDEFAVACPTKERWELLSLAIGAYLAERTGLPVDFQVQQQSAANEKHPKMRNPLGTGLVLASGGDGTPAWDEVET